MRRRSLNSPSRFEALQARRGDSLRRALHEAGLELSRGNRIDDYRVHVREHWPEDLEAEWLQLALEVDRSQESAWPCVAWPDGGGWCFCLPVASLDYLISGPPLRHYAIINFQAFAALLRGRQ